MAEYPEFPDLHMNEFQVADCTKCKLAKQCINLPCSHFFCSLCYCKKYKKIINKVMGVLYQNPEILNNTYSSIGCPYQCASSSLSIPPMWLSHLFHNFKELYISEDIKLLCTFFSGIPTYFIKCIDCRRLHSSTTRKFICS